MQIYTSEVHLTPSEKDVQKGSLECNNALLPGVSVSSSILKTEWRLLRELNDDTCDICEPAISWGGVYV